MEILIMFYGFSLMGMIGSLISFYCIIRYGTIYSGFMILNGLILSIPTIILISLI